MNGALFLVLLIPVLIAGLAFLSVLRSRRIVARMSLRLGGAPVGRYAIRLRTGGHWALLEIPAPLTTSMAPRLRLTILAPTGDLRMSLRPRGFWSQLLGTGSYVTGDAEFDRCFEVHGNRVAAASALHPGVRLLMRRGAVHRTRVEVSASGVTIELAESPYSEAALNVAADHALILARNLVPPAVDTRGIRILEVTESIPRAMPVDGAGLAPTPPSAGGQPVDGPVCPVCRDALVGEVVQCRACRTPHHRDCWLYNHSCSVYGCRESRFIDR